jgi:hypothetical protein
MDASPIPVSMETILHWLNVAFGPLAMASSTTPAENPMVKTKTTRISLTAPFLVTGKLHEHKTAGQRA